MSSIATTLALAQSVELNAVQEAKNNAIASINTVKDNILSAADTGTDTTLTISGLGADAAVVGQQFDDLASQVGTKFDIEVIPGSFCRYSGNIVESATYEYYKIYVNHLPNMKLTFSTYLTSTAGWAFFDSNDKLLSCLGDPVSEIGVNTYTEIVPNAASYLLVSCQTVNKHAFSIHVTDLSASIGDALRYNHVLTSQDDLNSVTTSGTYLFETESVPANVAFSNKSIVTVTTAQNLGYTTVLQFQQRVGPNIDQYIAFRNRTSSGTWSPWYYPTITSSHTDADTTLVYRGALTATDDLNTLTTNGMYYYSDSNIPLHAPCDYGGIIIVSGSNSSTSQKSQHFVGYGSEKNRSEAHREMAGSTWFNWRYVPYSKTTTGYVDCGKRISIVGDSISTFAGYVPTGEGYAAYYSGSNGGVKSVNETWWKRLIDETGMILCVNNSVSGSCCCSGIRTDRVEASNPTRTGGLADSDGNKPDIIIVYMGMNDYVNAAGQGTYNGTGEFPTDTSTFREAYSIMLNQIMTNYPMAKVYCCTLQHTASKSTTKRSVDYTTDGTLKRDWNNIIRELAQLFNCEIIDFESCGINAANIPYYTGDDNTDEDGTSGEGTLGRGLHPNTAGHELLYYEALKHFRKDWQI